jgi:hypothetical protein
MVVWGISGFNVYVMQCIYLCFVLSNPNYFPLQTSVLHIWDSESDTIILFSVFLIYHDAKEFISAPLIIRCPSFPLNKLIFELFGG